MDLTFFPLTLDAIDQAAAESLCLFVSSDERPLTGLADRKSTRLNSSHSQISYAVFCLKTKNTPLNRRGTRPSTAILRFSWLTLPRPPTQLLIRTKLTYTRISCVV